VAPKKVKVARVFPAGNREAVIAMAIDHDFKARRALFIIDGDLEWVRGDVGSFPEFVYRLDAYCIENLLIQEDAVARILIEELILSEDMAKETLQFDNWLYNVSSLLLDLFIWFAALNAVKASESTISLGIGQLLTPARKGVPQMLDHLKVEKQIYEIQQKTESVIGIVEAKELHDRILQRVNNLPNPSDAISGKDYLFPLFEYHLWHYVKRKTSRKSLRIRLARNCCLQRFAALSEAMAKSLKLS
jgi:hypothetical protein